MINAAENLNDLRVPPANHLELLEPKENKFYSIRVNKQYRLIFHFENGKISQLQLDPHRYDL
ncbi:Plasmid maintenance system killer protein [Gallibacterium anatis UMN179]|uniref:Plasmid maintenance system killer protein n=2 Tax=Gallibacterium anatis TaxID=750 RepID=F4H952_GALAU|nr:Plasmid maintenance system killer protein [Gallibacterium anatis UMN179]